MSEDKKSAGRMPDFYVYTSRDGSSHNTKIGGAWEVAKGGISITLDALPISGKLVLFPPSKEDAADT